MRALLFSGLVCFLNLACSDGGEADSGLVAVDAGEADAGARDSGLAETACGSATCTSDQYCQIDPTGACVLGGGACMPTEETCAKEGDGGCTTPRTRMCKALPAACATNAQCACMINQNLCPNQVLATCRRPTGQGVTIECPFP